MKLGEYLFKRVKELGVDHVFGIPGDFALPLFDAMDQSGLKIVVNTHEPSAGFAADAYARLRGLGVVVVTFGAGGLNMVNSIAQAYAEKSPVIVISGAPEIQGRKLDILLHHKVRTFETQLNVYKEITGAAVALTATSTATEEIDEVFETTLKTKRPGYIEVPRDLVAANLVETARTRYSPTPGDKSALEEAMREVIARLKKSRRPVVYAGVEIQRFNLREKLISLVQKLNLPITTSIEGKAVFPEDHPNFIGVYMGQAGSELARQAVEDSDCVLMLGAFLTDVNTGVFTAKVDRSGIISASSEEITVSYHRYPDVTLRDLIDYLLKSDEVEAHQFHKLRVPKVQRPIHSGPFTTADVIDVLNLSLEPNRYVFVSDVGDCLYACLNLRTDYFLGPGYYNSMGFGVPAAIAAALAVPEKRTVALVGDGGFQMTGMELSTAKKLGIRPIVIVLNNSRYATLEAIAGEKPYFGLTSWDYVGIAKAMGGDGARVSSRQEFQSALGNAERSTGFYLIEALVSAKDVSATWQKISEGVKSLGKA